MYFKCFQFSLFPLSESLAWEYLVSTHHYINQQYLVSNTAKRTISYQQHQYFMRRVRQEEVNAISFQESIIFINGLRIVTTKYSSHLTFWKAFYFFSEINWGICLLKPWTNTLSLAQEQNPSYHLCWPFPQDKNKFFSPRTWTPWWFLLYPSKMFTSNIIFLHRERLVKHQTSHLKATASVSWNSATVCCEEYTILEERN